jgi:hypothetical protein
MLKILFWLLLAINGALFALGQGLLDRHPQRTEPQRLEQQLHPEQLILTPPVAAAAVAPSAASSVAVATPAAGAAVAAVSPSQAVVTADQPAATKPPATPTVAPVSAPTPTPTPAPTLTPVAASVPAAPAVIAAAAPATLPAPAEKLLACVEIGNFDPNEARSFRNRLTAAKLRAQPSQHSVQEVASYMVYIAAEDGREGADRRTAELRRLGLTDFYVLPESAPMHDAISLGLFKTEAAAKAYVGQLISKGVRSARIIERNASTNKVAFRLRDLNAADQAGFAALVSAFPNQSRRDCSG